MYDFLVIGAGSGGVRFARIMGAKGFKVAIIEKEGIGGTCVLRGCVPKKMFIYAASFGKDINLAKEYGWQGELQKFDLWQFMQKKNKELARLQEIYTNVLKTNNVEIIKGEAKFISNTSVAVNGKKYSTKKFLIATGSVPKTVNIPGFNLTTDSTEFLNLTELPKEVLVLGGGYIAVEFINILLALGVKVHIFIRSGIPLRLFDKDISSFMKQQLQLQGVNFIKAEHLTSIKKNKKGKLEANFTNGEVITSDIIINAIGRKANTANLNIAAAGLIPYSDAIAVDDYFVSSEPNIYAIGDVINRVNLTPVATKQAMYLANNLTTNNPKPFNYKFIPKTVFSYPEVASCGLTEDEALFEMHNLEIYKSSFRPLKTILTSSKIKSFFKIIVDKETKQVLGMHIADINAGEIMQGFAAALKQGITKPELDEVIGIHPTSAEELVTMYNKV